MIKVVAKSVVKKEKIEEYKEMVNELIEKTRNEDKNISYELYQDVDNPQILTFIEEWEDHKGLEKHMSSDHFKKIVSQLNELRETSEVNVYKKVK
ncbi:MAG: putative quinol monooxygenase [Bacillota bacterium]